MNANNLSANPSNPRERWLNEALALIPDEYDYSDAEEYLRPLLKRCRSNSKHAWYQWLRCQLAKNQETIKFLGLMQESRVPLELKSPSETPSDSEPPFPFEFEVQGDIALILIETNEHHAIWRLPVADLDFARQVYPVYLKRLPPLEHPQEKELRGLRKKLERMRFSGAAEKDVLKTQIDALQESIANAYDPVPRYCLMKSINGRDVLVHRLFMNADDEYNDEQEVAPVDGDFLNFADTTIRVTTKPVVSDGLFVAKGDNPHTSVQDFIVQNFQLVPLGYDAAAAKKFWKSMLQIKLNAYGDVSTTLPIQPNADLGKRTQRFGQIVDCGRFDFNVATEDRYSPERFHPKHHPKPTVRELRNAWDI